MCFKIIKRLFGGGGESGSATQAALEAARRAAETAATDEEGIRRAQELRLRKLAGQRGQGDSFRGGLGKAPTAVRMLLGQ